MNKRKNYVAPDVKIYRVIMEANIADTPISYKMSISGNVEYEDYTAGTDYEAVKDVIIIY